MPYILKKDNVERIVDSENDKEALEKKGYVEVVVKTTSTNKKSKND